MSEIAYGWREGPGKGREIGIAASQYFHRRGGHFVYIDSSGDVNLCGSVNVTVGYSLNTAASSVYGWLETPKDTDGYNSWKSSGTAGNDKAFVIYGLEDVFEIPAADTTTASLSYIGRHAAINLSGADGTYNRTQTAKYYGTAASTCLEIVDADEANQTVFVKIKPAYKQ